LLARYSSSPALRLRIGKSHLRPALYTALCCITLYAVWRIWTRGYPFAGGVLLLFAVALLWRLRRDAMVGAELCWQQGCWVLQRGTQQRVISLSHRCIATPWVIYLEFSEQPSGNSGQLWLYADCASVEQLRRLRVRVALLQ
jgi:hypothetical protein